jgi:hypothetical protein
MSCVSSETGAINTPLDFQFRGATIADCESLPVFSGAAGATACPTALVGT